MSAETKEFTPTQEQRLILQRMSVKIHTPWSLIAAGDAPYLIDPHGDPDRFHIQRYPRKKVRTASVMGLLGIGALRSNENADRFYLTPKGLELANKLQPAAL